MAIKMEHKPMTRGDEIRAMDDKALARFIMQIEELEGPKYCQCRPECVMPLWRSSMASITTGVPSAWSSG